MASNLKNFDSVRTGSGKEPVLVSLWKSVICIPLVASCLAATSAEETETSATWLERSIELPAHRALERMRTQPGTTLTAFTTDGCSGGMSSVWAAVAKTFPNFAEAHRLHPPWEDCCVIHDRSYHDAGPDPDPEQSFDARLRADQVLRTCVQNTTDDSAERLRKFYGMSAEQVRAVYATIADAMFLSVRLGGVPCSGLPWRWGYGYPHCNVFTD